MKNLKFVTNFDILSNFVIIDNFHFENLTYCPDRIITSILQFVLSSLRTKKSLHKKGFKMASLISSFLPEKWLVMMEVLHQLKNLLEFRSRNDVDF